MNIIGIDPGLDGAVAIIEPSEFMVWDTPTLTVKGAKGNRREYALVQMADWLRPWAGTSVAFIENVHAMPGQGVRSMFTMGYGVGAWHAILATLGIIYTTVTPQRWKGVLLDGMGKDKDAGRLRAMQLFPSKSHLFDRKKDDGRADAILIAEYGRRYAVPGRYAA
jgi:crossover junction endodeoxyribonuclease RuvC